MALGYKDLLRQVDSLSESFPTLGSRLSQAAKELQSSGIPPSDSLVEELTAYGKNFAIARNQAVELGKSLRSPSNPVSLQDIRDLVQAVATAQSNAETRQKALNILDRVLAIVHREQNNFPPLEPVRDKASELYRTINNPKATQLHPDAIALVEEKHPFSALLTLVEQGENLDDSRWVSLEEIVSASFGKQLVVAISRGKLTLTAIAATPNLPVASQSVEPERSLSLPLTLPQVTAEALPEVIIIPSTVAVANKPITVDPDITILESPASGTPIHEVIVVPSVNVNQPLQNVQGQHIVFGQTPRSEGSQQLASVGLKVLAHIQSVGDRTFAAQEYAGSRGKGLRLEGFQINIDPAIPGLSIQYMAHVEGVGDTAWINEGDLAGFRGKSKRIEGFAIRLAGPEASKYDVFYTAHIQNIGDTPPVANGQYCGTRGKSLRVESMKVWVLAKN